MKTESLRVPKAILHKPSGQAVVLVRDADGKRRSVYLGKHGSAGAEAKYRKFLTDHLANKPVMTPRQRREQELEQEPVSVWPTVGQLAAAFLLWASRYHVDQERRPTKEVRAARLAFEPLLDLHRDTPTDKMTIKALLDVRQQLLDARKLDDEGKETDEGRFCRIVINERVGRMKSLFR